MKIKTYIKQNLELLSFYTEIITDFNFMLISDLINYTYLLIRTAVRRRYLSETDIENSKLMLDIYEERLRKRGK